VFSKYAPLIAPYAAPSIVLTSTTPLINGGAPTTYNGISGVVDYLHAVSTARNSSHQVLSNLLFDFSADGNTVSVSTVYNGLESLNADLTFQTFFGTRLYQLTRDPAYEHGWSVTRLDIVRDVSRPSPDNTATYRGQIQEVVLAYVSYNDIASFDNAANIIVPVYGPLVAPYITSDFTVTSVSPLTGNATYGFPTDSFAPGVTAAVGYLHDVSSKRLGSDTSLSNFQFSFSDAQNALVEARYTGWEQLIAGGVYQIFYGHRQYTAVRQDDGTWLLSSAVIVRTNTFSQTKA